MTIWIPGIPIAQGSKTMGYTKSGKAYMRDHRATDLHRWRKAVRDTAVYSKLQRIEGPCSVAAIFCMPRPKRPKHPQWPAVKPDADKLLRAILDALTTVAYGDDSQVCHVQVTKRYEDVSPGLDGQQAGPGVLITVGEL